MTLTQLKALNKKNGGHFFDRDIMKSYGDTMQSLFIETRDNGAVVRVYRKRDGAVWLFSTTTGRVIYSVSLR